jgi:hypothetical protein
MSKYQVPLQELRTRAERLPLDVTMLGWFGQAGPQERYVPLDKLHCVALSRGRRPRVYKDLKLQVQPAVAMAVPAIWKDGSVHVGGCGWWQRTVYGEVLYSRERSADARPVGALKDLFETTPYSAVSLKPERYTETGLLDRKILKWSLKLLDEQQLRAQPSHGRWGDTGIVPPTFLCSAGRNQPLRLRQGIALDCLIRHCAEYGQWTVREDSAKVGELRTSVRGIARKTDDHTIHFVGDDPEQGQLEDLYSSYTASKQIEDLISEIFHVDMGVALTPLVPASGIRVKEGQALFGPVPKGSLGASDLRENPAYPLMAFMAALTTMHVVEGVPRLDCSVVLGSDAHKPVADMGSGGGYIQRLPNRTPSLRLNDDGLSIDLFNTSIREYLREKARARKAAGNAALPRPARREQTISAAEPAAAVEIVAATTE